MKSKTSEDNDWTVNIYKCVWVRFICPEDTQTNWNKMNKFYEWQKSLGKDMWPRRMMAIGCGEFEALFTEEQAIKIQEWLIENKFEINK